MTERIRNVGGMTRREKLKYLKKNLSQCHFVHYKSWNLKYLPEFILVP
jgi:hypothetical protein